MLKDLYQEPLTEIAKAQGLRYGDDLYCVPSQNYNVLFYYDMTELFLALEQNGSVKVLYRGSDPEELVHELNMVMGALKLPVEEIVDYAVKFNFLELAEYLVDYGISMDEGAYIQNPLEWAIELDHDSIAELFIDNGFPFGLNLMTDVLEQGNLYFYKKMYVQCNLDDTDKREQLHFAIKYQQEDILKYLIEEQGLKLTPEHKQYMKERGMEICDVFSW